MISAHQKERSDSGIISGGGNPILNYSFLIFIDSFNPFRGEYQKLKWFYEEGDNSDFDFSNTLEDLRELFDINFHVSINHIVYNKYIGETPFKLSVTFKDISLYRDMNHYIDI